MDASVKALFFELIYHHMRPDIAILSSPPTIAPRIFQRWRAPTRNFWYRLVENTQGRMSSSRPLPEGGANRPMPLPDQPPRGLFPALSGAHVRSIP
jgi:hypothetical protein